MCQRALGRDVSMSGKPILTLNQFMRRGQVTYFLLRPTWSCPLGTCSVSILLAHSQKAAWWGEEGNWRVGEVRFQVGEESQADILTPSICFSRQKGREGHQQPQDFLSHHNFFFSRANAKVPASDEEQVKALLQHGERMLKELKQNVDLATAS